MNKVGKDQKKRTFVLGKDPKEKVYTVGKDPLKRPFFVGGIDPPEKVYNIGKENIFRYVKRKKVLVKKTKERIPFNDTLKFNIRIGSGLYSFVSSITLKKNIVSLWILLMELEDEDGYKKIQEFIEKVCLKRWKKNNASGLSDFVTKCMVHSFLDRDDFLSYKRIYLSL